MTPERAQLLAELLTEVYEKDRGFIPDPAYRPLHHLCSWAAVELLLTRHLGHEVLLRYRNDDPWDGWHVIGGYVKPRETIQAFANRAVKEEKAGMIGVTNLKQIATAKWLDHPYGFPFCALLVCEPVGQVVERKDLRWFHVDSLPFGKMLHSKHDLYLRTYLGYLNNPGRYCPIIGE
jgi:8-oxo-dGTP pyrophosphatase MutT (NUDIX family)